MNGRRRRNVISLSSLFLLVSNIGGCSGPVGDPLPLMGFGARRTVLRAYDPGTDLILQYAGAADNLFEVDAAGISSGYREYLKPDIEQTGTEVEVESGAQHNPIFLAL